MNKAKKILVTGAAGFIGFHLCKSLLELGFEIIGVDNINDYYDPNLKVSRLSELGIEGVTYDSEELSRFVNKDFTFIKSSIENDELWVQLSSEFEIGVIINLAAQAGVRYSLENPKAYIKSNVEGFLNVLEFCRSNKDSKLIYASSSSVYGLDSEQPFSESEKCNKPISLYAATKRSNELMAYTYHHLFNIDSIGLRFFTVYGPWGRPDMAPFLFTKAAFEGSGIKVFNHGNQKRDFTYIDDIVKGIVEIFKQRDKIDGADICNIGQGRPIELGDFIKSIEKYSGHELTKDYVDSQPGDVVITYANTKKLNNKFSYVPKVSIEEGVDKFISWYKSYYNKSNNV